MPLDASAETGSVDREVADGNADEGGGLVDDAGGGADDVGGGIDDGGGDCGVGSCGAGGAVGTVVHAGSASERFIAPATRSLLAFIACLPSVRCFNPIGLAFGKAPARPSETACRDGLRKGAARLKYVPVHSGPAKHNELLDFGAIRQSGIAPDDGAIGLAAARVNRDLPLDTS